MEKLENNNNPVKIIEISKVSPLSSQHSKIFLPLSDFDWIFLNFPPRDRLLFYPIIHSNSFNSILPNLKHSLSITLQHFLPLAGHLVWPDDSPLPFILYAPNDAVSFTVAETTSDFNEHVSHAANEIKHSRFLVPTIQYSSQYSSIPMMAIQLTLFPNQGFSIGFSTHHVLCDGISFNLFLKSWAHICNKLIKTMTNPLIIIQDYFQLPLELNPSFERNSNNIPQNPFNFAPKYKISLNYNYDSSLFPPSNWLQAAFQLNTTQIHKLKKRVLLLLSKEEEFHHFSTFVIVYSYVLECLVKAKGEEGKEYINVIVTADVRGMMKPPISRNYFGNCVSGLGMVVEARELREDGFGNMAKKMRHMILDMRRSGKFKIHKALELEKLSNGESLGSIEVVTVAESPKFRVYESDFGWGKPLKYEMVSLVKNSFCLIDSRDGDGGVEVALLLPKHHMDAFASIFARGLNYDD